MNVTAVIPCNLPPDYFWDNKTGRASGFAVDLMEKIAGRAAFQVDYVCRDGWPEVINLIASGKADLGMMSINENRKERLMFSAPFDVINSVFFAPADSKLNIDTMPVKHTVGVRKEGSTFDALRINPETRVVEYDSHQQGLFGLLSGEIDLYAGPETTILELSRRIGIEGKIKVVGKPIREIKRGFAVRKGNEQLLASLNKAMDDFIGSPEYHRIFAKWYPAPEPYWNAKRFAFASGCLIFILTGGMGLWRHFAIRKLNKELLENIAERKKTEKEIREKESSYELLFESANDGIFIQDATGFRDCNQRGAEMYGLSKEALIGRSPAEFAPDRQPDGRLSVEVAGEKIRAALNGAPQLFEWQPLRADGTAFNVEITLSRLELGGSVCLQAIVRDITERKRAEEALKESEKLLRESQIIAGLGSYMLDIRTGVWTSSNVLDTLFGIDEAYERSVEGWEALVHPDDRTMAADYFRNEVLGLGKSFDKEYRIIRHDDQTERWVHGSGKLELDAHGCPLKMHGTIQDITGRKKLEEQLRQAQKLESIGTLAGGIAHDFNNLLQGIFGYISLAKATIDQKEKSLSMIEQAEEALHLSVNLTNQLLTFSKGGKPVKKLIRIRPAVENAVKFALSGSHTDYEMDIPADLRSVEADEGQLAQVIQNIVLNANEAMAGSGTVRVSLANVDIAKKTMVSIPEGGPFVRIAIQDSGMGIPGQNLARIFDPYFTTKQKGSGLGLATSYSIIKNHGGVIEVKSDLNRGTTFTIYLPASKGSETAIATPPSTAVGTKKGRVLLMDDEDLVRNVAKEMIAALGHEVEGTEDGKRAIELFRRAREAGRPFDLVILDLTIKGGMGGEETIRKIRDIDPNVKAIVSSGYADNPVVANYSAYGFSAVLNKPYRIDALQNCFNQLIS